MSAAKQPIAAQRAQSLVLPPPSWPTVPLGEIAEIVSGITLGRAVRERTTRPVPYLRVANVKDGWLDLSDVYQIEATEEEIQKCRLRHGDILLTEGGDPDKLGRGTFWEEQIQECLHQNHIFRLRLPPDRFCHEFISYQFASPYGKAYFFSHAKQTTGIATINSGVLKRFPVLAPPLPVQRFIAARLREKLAEIALARASLQAQLDALETLIHAILRESLDSGKTQPTRFRDCLLEVTEGIGKDWPLYPVLGATRDGLAPAKEPVGKNPGRYKPVRQGTIFYNPMRILLGSIAILDQGDTPGITSPDYVVMTAVESRLNAHWFYHWFRSNYGAEFIKSMTRGAVRERLMFKRLAPATIAIPDLERQQAAYRQLAEIRNVKAPITQQLETIDQLPAMLLREAFIGWI